MQPATCTSHAARRAALEHRLHDRGVVERRLGVRHADHRGATTERRGPRAGLDRLGVFATRLAEVHLDVDEPGRDDAALGVEHRRARRRVEPRADLGDQPVDDATSATRSPVSSTTRPPVSRTSDNGASRAEQRPQHGHAHRDAVGTPMHTAPRSWVGPLRRRCRPHAAGQQGRCVQHARVKEVAKEAEEEEGIVDSGRERKRPE